MVGTEDVLHIIIITVLELSAALANVILIAAISSSKIESYDFTTKLFVCMTPKALFAYSIILLSSAWVDLVAALASWMCAARVQNIKLAMVLIYVGPCTLMGARWCHAFLCLHCGAVGQSIVLLLVSFSYRVWILNRSLSSVVIVDAERSRRQLRAVCFLVTLPVAVHTTIMATSAGSFPRVPSLEPLTFSVFNLTDASFPSTDNMAARATIFSLIPFYAICFCASFVMRRQLLRALAGNLKAPDRHNHRTILRTLTIQCMVPLTYVFTSSLWVADVFGIVESTTVRRAAIVMSSVFALVTPLTNLYYLQPYRKYCAKLVEACVPFRLVLGAADPSSLSTPAVATTNTPQRSPVRSLSTSIRPSVLQ